MKHVLVTGGCGFIGSNFIRFFLHRYPGFQITNLDKLTYAGNIENLRDVEKQASYQLVQGDICDTALVRRLVDRTDWIIHFASETHVDRSISAAGQFVRTNIVGTQVLLDAVLAANRIERMIHFSTDEVYGSTQTGEFYEDSPFRPTSPYAASKAAADLLAQAYRKTYRLPVVILRGSNNYGPWQYPEKVIPLFITNLIEGKKLPLYSRGENSREWIYVEDTCRAIVSVLERTGTDEIYNVGSGKEINNYDLSKMILRVFERDESWISFVKDRPAHDLRYRLNSGKIKAFGFKTSARFQDDLHRTIAWYREHESWWKPLKNDCYTLK